MLLEKSESAFYSLAKFAFANEPIEVVVEIGEALVPSTSSGQALLGIIARVEVDERHSTQLFDDQFTQRLGAVTAVGEEITDSQPGEGLGEPLDSLLAQRDVIHIGRADGDVQNVSVSVGDQSEFEAKDAFAILGIAPGSAWFGVAGGAVGNVAEQVTTGSDETGIQHDLVQLDVSSFHRTTAQFANQELEGIDTHLPDALGESLVGGQLGHIGLES